MLFRLMLSCCVVVKIGVFFVKWLCLFEGIKIISGLVVIFCFVCRWGEDIVWGGFGVFICGI